MKSCMCGHNRWRTKRKGQLYQCRRCGFIRDIMIPENN